MKYIEFENITFGYGKDPIFKDLSFRVSNISDDEGYIIALMGQSGIGKTTLLNLILGSENPQNGRIKLSPASPVIAYLTQEPVLFEHLSIVQNARYFASTKQYKNRFDAALFEELVESLNMRELISSSKSVLKTSGGEKQKISLIRALSIKPDFLILDEPTTGLDSEIKLQFLNKLRELVGKYNLLVMYVTHNKIEAELIVDEIVYLVKNNENVVNKVYQDKILAFVNRPPIEEALRVFNYPKANLIRMKNNNGLFLPAAENESEFVMNINDENVGFVDCNGYAYKIVSSNPIYTMLELSETSQIITISTKHFIANSKSQMIFLGENLRYVGGLLIN